MLDLVKVHLAALGVQNEALPDDGPDDIGEEHRRVDIPSENEDLSEVDNLHLREAGVQHVLSVLGPPCVDHAEKELRHHDHREPICDVRHEVGLRPVRERVAHQLFGTPLHLRSVLLESLGVEVMVDKIPETSVFRCVVTRDDWTLVIVFVLVGLVEDARSVGGERVVLLILPDRST